MVSNLLTRVNFLALVQDRILLVEELMRSQSDGHHPGLGAAMEHLLASGGKRVRPAVALLTGDMLGASTDRVETLGAAIELLHTATLVHDDLIDGALLRRGIATLNSQWSPAATVLTGDYIFARAAKLAAETNSIPVMRLFSQTLATIVNGELTQLFASRGLASREDYFQRIYAKTASMFELATAAAAMLSPADSSLVEEMRGFGYDIGMAFQIVDDVLDFTAEQATLGKPVASDLRQGLITLPALFYVERHPEDAEMQSILEGHFFSDERIDRLVNSIRESGAIQYSMNVAQEYVDSGLMKLHRQRPGPARDALEELSRYIVDRNL
jgi:geranylgeranyl pyrophosphate synthase